MENEKNLNFLLLKKRILGVYNACLIFLLLFTCGGVDFGKKSDALSEKHTEKANIPYESGAGECQNVSFLKSHCILFRNLYILSLNLILLR